MIKLSDGSKTQGIFSLLILAILTVIFFWKAFFLGYLPLPADIVSFLFQPWKSYCQVEGTPKNPLISDCITQFYPTKEYSSQIIKEKGISLWNPLLFCGTPCLTLPFIPPLNMLLFLFPPHLVYKLTIILQIFLCGLFMYLFLSVALKINPFGSLIGAIVFMLNGVFAVWLEFETTVGGGLWFPIIFLLIDRLIVKQNLVYFILTTLSIGIRFFSSHLQFAILLLLSSFIYASFKILLTYKAKRDLKGLLRSFATVICAFILGISLASIYILPTFKEAEASFRPTVEFRELNPLPVANLVTFVIPDFYGTPAPPHSYETVRSWFYGAGLIKMKIPKVGGRNYNEYCGYIGVLPLILALLAGLLRKDKDTRFFFCFWIVSLLLALGTFLYLPLYWFVPGFNKIGISRSIFLFCFSGSILAGMGAEHLTAGSREQGTGSRKEWIIRIVVWILAIATLGWLMFLLLPKFNLHSTIFNLQLQLLAWHFSLRNPSMNIPILLVFSSIIILSLLLKAQGSRLKTQSLKGAILLVISFDLLYFGMKYNPMTPKEWLFPETPSLSFLTAKLDEEPPFRIAAFGCILPPNTNIIYKLQSVEGYESFHSARYHDFMKELVSPDVYHNWINIFSQANRKFLQVLNVKYILAENELEGEDLKPVYDGEIKIYEDLKAFPRAWIVPEGKVLKTKEEIFDELKSLDFDPKKAVILEEEPQGFKGSKAQGEATIIEYQPEKVIIQAELNQDGFLVLSDSWYPGWKVFVNGKKGKILRANYIMRAVQLSNGRHLVEFIYDPPSFKVGLFISLTIFILILILLVVSLKRWSKR
ncbi:TPA: hypothetical protein DCX15_01100 [bacterium]|nr:hypothetical protein [bacterium]